MVDVEQVAEYNPNDLDKIKQLVETWHQKSRAVLEWRTPENEKAAQIADQNLAGWITPLIEEIEILRAKQSEFWTHDHIMMFLDNMYKEYPIGTPIRQGGREGQVMGVIHFAERAGAKIACDFGDGTEYFMNFELEKIEDEANAL